MSPPPRSLPAQSLGRLEERTWEPDLGAPSRKHRRGGRYAVFIPERIAEREFGLDEEAVAAVVDATRQLVALNSSPPRAADLGAVARNLLRSEAVASSRIEGLALSQKRLARAAYRHGSPGGDRQAAEILANVEALHEAVELGARAEPLRVDDVLSIHRTLLRFTCDQQIAGTIRTSQNWIGGSDFHPLDAAFVPPPAEHVRPLLEDLCAFVAREDVAPVAQAAIAHAQFETIHAFADGNGRVGRAIVSAVLRRRGETPLYLPPISLVLAAEPGAYIEGLVDFREGRVSDWVSIFASATSRASVVAVRLSERIEKLRQGWLERLGGPRRDAAVRQLIAALPSQPVIDVAAGQQITGKSHVAVGRALNQLEAVGALTRLDEKKWGRLWECDALLQLATDFERDVATP